MPKVSIIAAIAENMAIGKSNKLLCYLPADLKHFKEITTGHVIIMGRHTFNSLPIRPLPNRKNIVLTSMLSDGVTEGYFEVSSLEEALYLSENENEVFIIGGGSVYKQSIERADAMYITLIHHEFDADTFFPQIQDSEWKIVSEEKHPADEKNPYSYSFIHYERKK